MSTPDLPRPADQAAKDKLEPAMVKLIAILLVGAVPALLDTTIVNVAIETIGRDLHATVASIQWVITGYLLSFGMVIPLSGWALARFGGRATWIFAVSVFLAGSLASGAAWNVPSLIAFRVVQGIGGGLMMPLLTTLILQAAGGRGLGKLMAAVSLPVAVVPILGPVISGVIISNASWRWIFYVNAPICAAAIALAWRGLAGQARPKDGPRPRLDVIGLLLICPALAGLLYGLAEVSSKHSMRHPQVIIPLCAGAVLLVAFVLYALRAAQPLVDLRLFAVRSFAGASWVFFLAGLSIYGAMLLLPLYFQQARGFSALGAGLMMVPQGVGTLLPRVVVGKLTDRLGARPVALAGVLIAAAGTAPFAVATPHTGELVLALLVRGAGLGAATIAVMAGAFQGLAKQQVPHASIGTRVMQQVGGAFGAAVLVVILSQQATAHAAAGPAGLVAAFGHTFWWCIGFTALAIVPALLLPGRSAQPAVAQAAPAAAGSAASGQPPAGQGASRRS